MGTRVSVSTGDRWLSRRALVIGAVSLASCSSSGGAPEQDAGSTVGTLVAVPKTPDSVNEEREGVDPNAPGPQRVEVVGRIPGAPLGISPDGRRIAIGDGAADDPLCVYDVSPLAVDFCIERDNLDFESGDQVTGAADVVAWSPDGLLGAFSPQDNADLSLIETATGTATNVHDDGVIDSSPAGVGVTAIDFLPVWLDETTVVYLHQPAPGVPPFVSLQVFDVKARSVVRNIELPTVATSRGRTISRIEPTSVPLAVGPDRVILVGDGAVFEVDVAAGSVVEVVDFSLNYTGNAPFFQVSERGNLAPTALIAPDRLLVFDAIVQRSITANDFSGATSGLLVIDLNSGSVTDAFAQSGPTNGWVGPTSVAIDPVSGEWIVWWVDSTRRAEPSDGFVGIVSVLDPDEDQLPVDPRDLPVLYDAVGDDALFVAADFAALAGRTHPVTDGGLLAATGRDGNTMLLQLGY